MAYTLTFTRTGDSAMDALEPAEKRYVRRKLAEITTSEFRHPSEWEFEQVPGCADGRFRVGHSLRVFADIDDDISQVRVSDVRRRENCYS